MKSVASIADLIEARSQARAFIFLWANWAIHARDSEFEVRRLLTTWERDYPMCPTPAYHVDVSEQKGEIWDALSEWLQAEPKPLWDLMWAGAGALLWVQSGSIIAAEKYAAHAGHDQLLAVSQRVFLRN